jgi:hypothetical protein
MGLDEFYSWGGVAVLGAYIIEECVIYSKVQSI